MGLAATAALALASSLAAQVTEGPLSPAGRLRVEVAPSFFHWGERFGFREEEGRVIEEVEPLGFDLESGTATDLFPGVALLESSLRDVLDEPAFQAALGSSHARVAHDVTRVPLRVDLGVFDWLTVGATVPFVLTRTEATLLLRVDPEAANLGVSPAVTSASAVAGFLEDLAARAAAAAARAQELCAGGDPSCADVEALAAEAAALDAALRAAYGAAPLFPVEGTAAGTGLRDRLSALNGRLEAAGVGALTRTLPLAGDVLDAEGFDLLFSDPRSGLQAGLPERRPVWELGDVELTTAVRLLEGEILDSAGATARTRWQVGARALVRLGTGSRDDPDVYLDVGAGDGQTDIELGAFANARSGSVAVWADARWGVQRPTTLIRRVAAPDVVLAPVATRLPVRWTPGDYLQLELSPRWHPTTELAVAATWRLFTKGRDAYELMAAPDPDVVLPDASLLERESEATLHELGAGLVFSTLEAWRDGRTAVPFEVRFGVQAGVAGSGGRTPRGVRVQGGLRIYQPLWGR